MKKIRGRFWLPETPDNPIAGTLRFSPGDGGRLSLIGHVEDPASRTPLPDTVDRILGESTGGRPITLDNCLQTTWHVFCAGVGEQSFHLGVIFDGLEYEAHVLPEFEEVVVGLRHLRDWTGLDGLTETHSLPQAFGLTLDVLPAMASQIFPGVELLIGHTAGVSGAVTVAR
jgi:hypothetical protein